MSRYFFKKLALFLFFLAFFALFGQKKPSFNDFYLKFNKKIEEKRENYAFKAGEKLKYKVSYGRKNKRSGKLLAAYAHLNIIDTVYKNQPSYLLNAFGKTTRLFSLFMKIEHSYSSIIDTLNLNTLSYSMDIQEGKYGKKTQFVFNTDSAHTQQKNDLLGLGYRLRTIENLKNKIGDTLFFSYHYNNQYYQSHLEILGEEIIKTKFGKINTLKLSPLLEKGRVFKSEKGALIWVSADNMHIPLKMELPVLVGSIYVTLDAYQNTLFNF
tara:strand:+ start:285 stop:1088 length:804 start_codon:yes stop_codon:yes gene_type:complete